MKNLIKFFMIMAVLCTVACSQTIEEKQVNAKGRLVMNIGNESRTIMPEITKDAIKSAVLTANNKEIKSWTGGNIISQIQSTDNILLDVGNYKFEMKFMNEADAVLFYGVIANQEIKSGDNSLTFVMENSTEKYNGGNGNVSIELSWTADRRITQIKAGLYDIATGEAVTGYEAKELTITTDTTAKYDKENIRARQYIIKFEIYSNNEESNPDILMDIIKVVAGITTSQKKELGEKDVNTKYTITYKLDGGSWKTSFTATTERNAYTKVSLPTADDITKTGYTFDGWYTDENLTGEKITEINSGITGDITLYVKWIPITYSVMFDANGGSGTMQNQTFTYDVKQSLTANSFTRDGHAFAGWATSANDGDVVYTNEYEVLNLTAENDATVTLYAVWVSAVYYVKSKADGTTGENADGTENNPFATMQEAVNKINEVNDGLAEFTINVQSDINPDTTIYYENNNNALININPDKALNLKICGTLQNTYGTYPTISASGGQQQGRVMYIGGNAIVTLENITLANGYYSEGAGVYVGKGSTFNMNSGATISNCTATTDGGGVYVINASTFTMTGGTIQNCEAFLSGGGVWMNSGSSFTMSGDSKIENCNSSSEGGGVYVTDSNNPCSFTMNDSATITGCTAQNYGGGGVSYGCGTNESNIKFTMNGGTISDCSSSNGGGVYLYGCFEMTGGTISGNEASNGAGVYVRDDSSSFTMNGGTISDNKATGYGGGVYLSDSTSSFIMEGGIIGKEITEGTEGNKQSWEYAATDTNYSNYASKGGGGIYAENGTVSIEGGKISYNYVPDPDGNGDPYSTQLKQGGGIFIEGGTLTLKNAEVSYNRGYQGGGVRCSGTDTGFVSELKLDNATIKGNAGKYKSWSNFGGGLVIRKVTKVDFGTTPSIIEENYSADGGAVFIEDTTVTLKNITIQNNKYDTEGYRYGSEVLLFGGADVSINESPDNVKIASNEGETQGICIHADSNGQTNALNLSGNVKLDTPIYLVEKTKINITGDLTVDKVATITLDDTFTERTQVLQAGDGVTLANQVRKFAVTSDSSGTRWTIDVEGKLQKQE